MFERGQGLPMTDAFGENGKLRNLNVLQAVHKFKEMLITVKLARSRIVKTTFCFTSQVCCKTQNNSYNCNWTRTQNHLVLKRTLNHLAKLTFRQL